MTALSTPIFNEASHADRHADSRPHFLCKSGMSKHNLGSEKRYETYFEFFIDRYNVQKTPHVDWKGTRYGRGIKRKLINWIECQLSVHQGSMTCGAHLCQGPYLPVGDDERLEQITVFGLYVMSVTALHDSHRP